MTKSVKLIDLPTYILTKIFNHLHYIDLLCLESTCNKMNKLLVLLLRKCGKNISSFSLYPFNESMQEEEKWQLTREPDASFEEARFKRNLFRLAPPTDQTSEVAGRQLEIIGESCGAHLEDLNLTLCAGRSTRDPPMIISRSLHNFLASCPRLKHLRADMNNHSIEFTGSSFLYLARGMRSLSFWQTWLPSSELRQIADRSGSTLQSLCFKFHRDAKVEDLICLFQKLTCLQHLQIDFRGGSKQPGLLTHLPFTQLMRDSLICIQLFVLVNSQLLPSIFSTKFRCLKTLEYLGSEKRDPSLPEVLTMIGSLRLTNNFPNLVNLCIQDSRTLDDNALKILAMLNNLEALRIIYCPKVTVVGISYFLDRCTVHFHHLELGNQLAEEGILELVHQCVDRRHSAMQRPAWFVEDPQRKVPADARLFYFLRYIEFMVSIGQSRDGEPINWNYPRKYKETYDNMNMHPWVVFSKPPELFHFEMEDKIYL
uniref:F-box domain-containing protein n=1 Tax=Ditylenchus dipsaci TaxID=166011 RepID=A0A915E0I9_9BILA